MATTYDMPTNEGSIALAKAVSMGAKLIIRDAALCRVTGGTLMPSVDAVANLTWDDLSSSAINGALMPCRSYLPCMYEYNGTEAPEKAVASLDIEFSYMPQSPVTYNVVAVRADIYYAITPFKTGNNYSVGDVVWLLDSMGATSHYRCTLNINGSNDPRIDTDHWTPVTLVNTMDERYGGLEYATISSSPILLYVSKSTGDITIDTHMEINYKVRLYLDNIKDASEIKEHVVFDTIGPEFMGSSQIALLSYMAKQMQDIRAVAMERASRS